MTERILVLFFGTGVEQCIFRGMQKCFAQIYPCFSHITYKQHVLM